MSGVSFILITVSTLLLFYFGTGKNKPVLFGSILWLCAIGGIAASGYFENTEIRPPRFLPVLVISFGLTVFLYQKVKTKPVNKTMLLAVHALRLPVELVLFQLFLAKQVPVLMTFRGWNFDILIGISALILLVIKLLTKREISRHFLIGWNICGIVFLLTIVTIAILSSPLPIQQWAFDQPNVALLKFPFIWLPAYVVPIVLTSHLLMLKKLLPGK